MSYDPNATAPEALPELPPSAPAKRRLPWLKLGLIVSLCLNIFLIAFGISRAMQPDPALRLQLRNWVATAPNDIRPELGRQLRQSRMALGAKARDAVAARTALLEALRADPFDAARLNAAFARLTETQAAAQGALQSEIAQAMARASQAERQQWADRLERSLHRMDGPPRGRGPGGGPPPDRAPRRPSEMPPPLARD